MYKISVYIKITLLLFITPFLFSCSHSNVKTLVTIADARINTAQLTDTGNSGDSNGDILTFDQPLLNKKMAPIGNNSGVCIRTRIKHNFQCQWTLSLKNGSIQVAGRELDSGTSSLSIIGGTGIYIGIYGEMQSVNNNDGTFTQTLYYWITK